MFLKNIRTGALGLLTLGLIVFCSGSATALGVYLVFAPEQGAQPAAFDAMAEWRPAFNLELASGS